MKNSRRCHVRRRRGLRHRCLRRRGLRLRGPFRLVDRVGSPRSLDPQYDGLYTSQVLIQLAAAAVVVGPCSSLHLSQGVAAADAGRPSLAPIHVPQQELQLPAFGAGTP